jgi:hypothetical protein
MAKKWKKNIKKKYRVVLAPPKKIRTTFKLLFREFYWLSFEINDSWKRVWKN